LARKDLHQHNDGSRVGDKCRAREDSVDKTNDSNADDKPAENKAKTGNEVGRG
jgi:hypothetical protein